MELYRTRARLLTCDATSHAEGAKRVHLARRESIAVLAVTVADDPIGRDYSGGFSRFETPACVFPRSVDARAGLAGQHSGTVAPPRLHCRWF